MSDSDNDLTIDIKEDDDILEDDEISKPSTSSNQNKDAKQKAKILIKETDNYDEDTAEEFYGEGDFSDTSDEGNSEIGDVCAICLGRIRGQIGSPDAEGCEHYFCLLCILEWAKNNPICPQDRRAFENVLVRDHVNGEVTSSLPTFKTEPEEEELIPDNPTYCEVCGSSEREDCLLLCDGCDLGYHLECLTPPLQEVPIEEWFCPLCVAADLPNVISQATLKDSEPEPKKTSPPNKDKKKRSSHQHRTRMIPRTRAIERVLQRISHTRKEIVKYKKKSGKKSSKKERKGTKQEEATVHAFRRARPFGCIADDDIDAAFNSDDYAEKLLNAQSAESGSRFGKKELALRKLHDFESTPLPSYAGRSQHPKLENCSSSNSTDLLINILEEQDVLLSKSKDISLTKERKLTKKEGSKPVTFNVDRENRIMSELLPSQKKAIESEEKTAAESKSLKKRGDSEGHKKSSSNGYSDYRRESSYKSSSDRRRHYHSPPSERSRKQSNSYYGERSRDKYDDRSHHRNRDRDSHRYRDRSKKDDRREYKSSRERYSHRSRDRRRDEYSHRRSSRTPERRHSKEGRDSKKSSSSKSFWGSSYVEETFQKEASASSSAYDQSLHTFSVRSTDQSLSGNSRNDKGSDFIYTPSQINVQGTITEEVSSSQSDPLISKTHGVNENDKVLEEKREGNLGSPVKTSNANHIGITLKDEDHETEMLSKVSDQDTTKEKFKSLFGDEESDPESIPDRDSNRKSKSPSVETYKSERVNGRKHHKRKHLSPDISGKRSPKRTFKDETVSSKNISKLNTEETEIVPDANRYECEEKVENSEQYTPSMSFNSNSEPYSPTASPTLTMGTSDDELGDIETLSQSSRALIFKSLFSRNRFSSMEDDSDNSSENNDNSIDKRSNESVEKLLDSSFAKSELEKGSKITKDEEMMENHLTKYASKKNNCKNKDKIFSTLFGDSLNSDDSHSGLEDYPAAADKKEKPNQIESRQQSATKESEKSKEIKPETSVNETVKRKEILQVSKHIPDEENLEKEKQKKLKEGVSTASDSKAVPSPSKIKLNKLHLETKVVDEAKKFLNPYYLEKGFSREVYKEIISKCVSKVLEVECSNTVDPRKIQKLVDGYVQVYMHRNKKNQMGKSAG